MAFIFKVKIRGISKPPVWRRISVPETFTFADLHLVIQAAFGWSNYHLYEFTDNLSCPCIILTDLSSSDDLYDPDHSDSRKFRLNKYFREVGDKFIYTYDLGDCWEHDIVLEKIDSRKGKNPLCLAGKGACPPEDCGGSYGYEIMKEEEDYEEISYFDLEDAQYAVKNWETWVSDMNENDLEEEIYGDFEDDDDMDEFSDDLMISDEQINKVVVEAVKYMLEGKTCYIDYTDATCYIQKPENASRYCAELVPPTDEENISFAKEFIGSLPSKDAQLKSSLILSLNKGLDAFEKIVQQSKYAENWREEKNLYYGNIIASTAMELYSKLMEDMNDIL